MHMDATVSSNLDFEHMFALAPVSLWLEDFSQVRCLFDRWRAAGVSDLRAHFAQDPEQLRQCMASLQVLRVNQRTLDLFAAASQEELVRGLDQVFRDDMLLQVGNEFEALWSGALEYSNQTVNYTLDGRRLDVFIRVRVLPGAVRERMILMLSALFVVGALTGAGVVVWGTLLQRLVPLDMIGRVASLDFFVSIAFMPVSIAIAGPLSLLVPIPIIFVIAGVIPPALALIALLAGRMRHTEEKHPLDVAEE